MRNQRYSRAFFIRHAKNIHFDNIYLDYEYEDGRPDFALIDAEGVTKNNIVVTGKVETSGDGSIRILFPAGQFQALMQRVICLAASISDLPCQDVGVLSGGPRYRNG